MSAADCRNGHTLKLSTQLNSLLPTTIIIHSYNLPTVVVVFFVPPSKFESVVLTKIQQLREQVRPTERASERALCVMMIQSKIEQTRKSPQRVVAVSSRKCDTQRDIAEAEIERD